MDVRTYLGVGWSMGAGVFVDVGVGVWQHLVRDMDVRNHLHGRPVAVGSRCSYA